MWQDNLSWKEGLFSVISDGKKFEAIKAGTEWDAVIAVFSRINKQSGTDWANLRLEGMLRPGSPSISRWQNLFGPGYFVVAIDTRLRAMTSKHNIKSREHLRGTISITVEYEVVTPELTLKVADPLERLQDRVSQTVLDLTANRSYQDIEVSYLRDQLINLETEREIGIQIYNALNIMVTWPEEIEDLLRGKTVTNIQAQIQNDLNESKIQKLLDFGITSKEVIARVLSVSDNDFQAIIGHVENLARAYREQEQRDLQLLEWLDERNYLTRPDTQKLADATLDNIITRRNSQSVRFDAFALTANDQKQLSSKTDSTDINSDTQNEQINISNRRIVNTSEDEGVEDKPTNQNPISGRRQVKLTDEEN